MALRCLIVDDNPRFGEEARSLLEHEGISVVGVAASGDEAARLAEALGPDLALVDISLGEESGFDVARRLWVTEGTVEKHVHSIFVKLRLPETDDDHRRVLAVVAFLGAR